MQSRQTPNFDKLPCTHPNYLRAVCKVILQEGGDLDAVLADAGTSVAELAQAKQLLPARQLWHVVRAAQRLAGRPTLALELGQSGQIAALGMYSMALLVSANLRQAVEVMERFTPLRSRNVRLRFQRTAEGIGIECQPEAHLGDLSAFVLDHFAATFSVFFTSVTGQSPPPVTLEVPWAKPGWGDAYLRLAGQVRFQSGCMAYWLPNAALDLPCPSASPSNFDVAWRQCEAEAQANAQQHTMTSRLLALLRSGNPELFRMEAACASLGVSRCTLLRRLQQEGSTFAALIEEERRRVALWQLRYGDKSVADIAHDLGYRDATNFSRTFRRWFSVSPSALREGQVPWPDGV